MICRGCSVNKEADSFPVRNDRSGRLRPYCYLCVNIISRARYENHKRTNPFKHKATRAKARALSLHVPYDLTPEYLESVWTGICPVLHTPISLLEQKNNEYAAELDRFIPSKGYIQGNVHFLSRRANRLKNNVTTKELQQLIDWMKEHEDK
jgi:hypothetical protein